MRQRKYSQYMDFCRQNLDLSKEPMVLRDKRLCETLRTNGYVYSPMDDEAEEWLCSDECANTLQNYQPGGFPAFVIQ